MPGSVRRLAARRRGFFEFFTTSVSSSFLVRSRGDRCRRIVRREEIFQTGVARGFAEREKFPWAQGQE